MKNRLVLRVATWFGLLAARRTLILRMTARLVNMLTTVFGNRRAIGLSNLRLAIPEFSQDEVTTIERRAYANLISTFVEFPTLLGASASEVVKRHRVENVSLLSEEHNNAKGHLLLSAHTGNWELLALSAALKSRTPFTIVAKDQNDVGLLKVMRERFGNRTVPFEMGAKVAMKELSEGRNIALLMDQYPSRGNVRVTFFGQSTRAFAVPARLALKYRPNVIVGFSRRIETGRYTATLERLDFDDLEDSLEGVQMFTQRYFTLLESFIHQYPDAWVWHHRRWKDVTGREHGA